MGVLTSAKMGGFRISALLAFLVVPILALPVHKASILTITFEPEPRGRGTVGLLLSCLITFGLCTWTSIHPNILPPGAGIGSRIKYKLVWMAVAVVFPQGIMLCAFGQWYKARTLRKIWADAFPVTLEYPDDNMGIEGGFFVLMGGFSLPPATKGGLTPVLTPRGFKNYVSQGKLDRNSFDRRQIIDKGKASSIAKVIAFLQASWLVFQVISRTVAGLPVTLLEIHVTNQVICTLASYFFWWYKPLDIAEAMEVKLVEPTSHEGCLREHVGEEEGQSRVNSLVMSASTLAAISQVVPPGNPSATGPALENQGGAPHGHSDEDESESEYIIAKRTKSTYKGENAFFDKDYKYEVITEKARSGFLHVLLRAIYDIAEYLIGYDIREEKEEEEGQRRVEDTSGDSPARCTGGDVGVGVGVGAGAGTVAGGDVPKGYTSDDMEKDSSIDKIEPALEKEVRGKTPEAKVAPTESGNKTSTGTTTDEPPPPSPKSWKVTWDKAVMGTFLTFNGAFHLVAWNVDQDNRGRDAEMLIWKISCLAICISALVFTVIFTFSDTYEDRFLAAAWETRFFDREVLRHLLGRFKQEISDIRKRPKWLWKALVFFTWFLLFVYVIGIIYITLESFLQLRGLNEDYYHTPTWVNYWPVAG